VSLGKRDSNLKRAGKEKLEHTEPTETWGDAKRRNPQSNPVMAS